MDALLFREALAVLPARVRQDLLDDRSFVSRCGVATTISVRLGSNGPSFVRHILYDAIRLALQEPAPVLVKDEQGSTFEILASQQEKEVSCTVRAREATYLLPNPSGLARDPILRCAWFEEAARDLRFADLVKYKKWLDRLRESPLEDDEYAEVLAEIANTPSAVHAAVRHGANRQSIELRTIAPVDLAYYQRLVGRGAPTFSQYLRSSAQPLIDQLERDSSSDALRRPLLLCSASSFARALSLKNVEPGQVRDLFDWLAEYGDPISCVGAIEAALASLDDLSTLNLSIGRIVERILADESTSDVGAFSLLSAIAQLVAAELARRPMLRLEPPFYRRQAALAQASLIARATNELGSDRASLVRFVRDTEAPNIFYLQGLIDLRREPRWLPDFLSPEQLRAELISRIRNCSVRHDEKLRDPSLRTLLLGHDSKVVVACAWPVANFPGPMEGESSTGFPIPQELLELIKSELTVSARVVAASFAPLVNSALHFLVPPSAATLAADALRRSNFHIDGAEDPSVAFNFASGLAIVAATTRSAELAKALRVLLRVMRRRKHFDLGSRNELRIAMIASAANEELEDWVRFAGEWISEIAFETSDSIGAKDLAYQIRKLVQLEPKLAAHCVAAEAAAESFAR